MSDQYWTAERIAAEENVIEHQLNLALNTAISSPKTSLAYSRIAEVRAERLMHVYGLLAAMGALGTGEDEEQLTSAPQHSPGCQAMNSYLSPCDCGMRRGLR